MITVTRKVNAKNYCRKMAQAALIDKCDLCQTEDNVNFFCENCDEILCTICKVGHAKSKSSRNHKIIHLLQARYENIVHKSTTVYCSEHSTVEVTLFCLKCDKLICTQCTAKKHKGHQITTPDAIRESKAEELNKFIKILKEKKVLHENAFQGEDQAHSRFTKSIDKVREEISNHKAKIIEELNIICNEQNAELTKFQESENKRYSDACNEIQIQNEAIISALQFAENSMDSNNSALIIQASVDTAHTLQGLEDPTMPQATTVMYQPGDRSHANILHVQGKVNILAHGAKSKPSTDVHKGKLKEQDDNKPSININYVKVKSTIKVKNKSTIHVIVPLMNKTAWVKGHKDPKCLSLIDRAGKVITMSDPLSNEISDAKAYRNTLLVTCFDQYIYQMSAVDGKLKSTFSDLSPYSTLGLCVTEKMDVIVCLYRSSTDIKVVRLNTSGHILQTFQHDVTGAPLYSNPWNVTSLTTGEIFVVDGGSRIVGVDREGPHLFTCDEIEGKKLHRFNNRIAQITHDSNNNLFVTAFHQNRVYVLRKDGRLGMCVLDSTQGIDCPVAIVIDNTGQLWVGCRQGQIHIIDYQ